ncbi:DM13 domain-containing protein [Algimonas porphyrae]|uniref:DM13 domain-containing protein n=1 Tax=Algimonas porphyrae TaxID=1128113 RepID=A0ABQ5V0M6_9PROT|nr:DM13 domain-containing protein [Algimonas porphyrae]GLQ20724.1 hypothetical protein GCM10007854_16790 [Algimonas porphyrae]
MKTNSDISRAVRARLATVAALGVIYPVAALGAALCATTMFSGAAFAAEASAAVQVDHTSSAPAEFQKKSFSLKGSVTIEQRGDRTVIVFSDDFRTKNGPDLKVFLSQNTVTDATGRNATQSAVRLGVLTSNKGGQEYVLPAGINLADYNSVLVHCEAYSKLWGGADI